jgi:D-alanyl-D-alanine carboxypeptidase (penicillin-binding protein 5/6)
MKRIIAVCLLAFCLLLKVTGLAWGSPAVSANSAILMDVTTGKILYQKNIHQQMEPASTTKILTAIVAIENGDLNSKISVSKNAARVEGSSIWLSQGEVQTLEDLLYGVLLSSGNDASVAVAEHIAGDQERFAVMLNEKARAIGARESNFVNPHGLPESGHLTTVNDMALITRYALHNPVFAIMVSTRQYVIPWPGNEWDRSLTNHNKLLWRLEGADGVKTGYTRSAGHCLVASATRENHQLLAVVFKSQNMYNDCANLLEWGFANYDLMRIAAAGEIIGAVNITDGVNNTVNVLPAQTLNLVLEKNLATKIALEVDLPSGILAPVERLQKIGKLRVACDGEVLAETDLIAEEAVARRTLLQVFIAWLKRLFGR